jgi:hypothetical protein
MESKVSIPKANEEFFNNLVESRARHNIAFKDFYGKANSQGYITTLDWRYLVKWVKINQDLDSIGKNLSMISAYWPNVVAVYDRVKEGKLPVLPDYDVLIGKLKMKADTTGKISKQDAVNLAGIVKKGIEAQRQSPDFIRVTQAGLDTAQELSKQIELGLVDVVE